MPIDFSSLRAITSMWSSSGAPARRPSAEPVPASRAEQSLRALLAPSGYRPAASCSVAANASGPSVVSVLRPNHLRSSTPTKAPLGAFDTSTPFDGLATVAESPESSASLRNRRRTLRPTLRQTPAESHVSLGRVLSAQATTSNRQVEVVANRLQHALRAFERGKDAQTLYRAVRAVSEKLGAADGIAHDARARLEAVIGHLHEAASTGKPAPLWRAQAMLEAL